MRVLQLLPQTGFASETEIEAVVSKCILDRNATAHATTQAILVPLVKKAMKLLQDHDLSTELPEQAELFSAWTGIAAQFGF